MNVWPFITQCFCLSSTCSARSRKYGIQPISPSDRAIFRFGYRWNMPLNSHESIAPDVRTAPQVRLAMNGASGAICGICDDDPTCIDATISSSFAVDITGSQYRSLSWIVGSPSGAGFSEKANAVTPRSAMRPISSAARCGSHIGISINGM